MNQLDADPSEHPECKYCREFLSTNAHESNVVWNRPVLESENFLIVPTLGHLVPGWLLLVPRKHYICMGALPAQLMGELLSLKRSTELLLGSLYCAPIKFEHGPCSYGLAGACVDHAHMHFVPAPVDLRSELDLQFPRRYVQGLNELSLEYRSGRPYFFYEAADGSSSLYEVSVIPSQFARMLVARKLGMLDKYDWRKHAGEEQLTIFLNDLHRTKDRGTRRELHA